MPVVIAAIFVALVSLLREPTRLRFNAIFVAGAGSAYLSGGFGVWEFPFTAVMTYLAFRGLDDYRFIGAAWMLHVVWDVLHHLYGQPDRVVSGDVVGRLRDHRRADRDLVLPRRAERVANGGRAGWRWRRRADPIARSARCVGQRATLTVAVVRTSVLVAVPRVRAPAARRRLAETPSAMDGTQRTV